MKHEKHLKHDRHDGYDLNCEQFKGMAAAYALRALDEADRLACTHHLARIRRHHGCAEAVEQARRITARLAAAVPPQPSPPGLWHAVVSRIVGVLPMAIDRRRRLRTRLRPRRDAPAPHAHR